MEKQEGIAKFFKRKARVSSEDSETHSPEKSKIKLDSTVDLVDSALDMAQEVGVKLDEILKKLSRLEIIESQVVNISDSLDKINKKIDEEVGRLDGKILQVSEKLNELEAGVNFISKDLDDTKKSSAENESKLRVEIETLEYKVLNLEVYQRRENLRFYGIPETENATETDGKTTEMVLRDFLENILDIYVSNFQRVHRVGRNTANRDRPRPIIARFQKYPEVVEILKQRKNLDKNAGYGIGPDLPKKVIELRKHQIPRLLEARKDGRTAFFSRAEPWRLMIDGRVAS